MPSAAFIRRLQKLFAHYAREDGSNKPPGLTHIALFDEDDITSWFVQFTYREDAVPQHEVVIAVKMEFVDESTGTEREMPLVFVVSPRLVAPFIHQGAVCMLDLLPPHGGNLSTPSNSQLLADPTQFSLLLSSLYFTLNPLGPRPQVFVQQPQHAQGGAHLAGNQDVEAGQPFAVDDVRDYYTTAEHRKGMEFIKAAHPYLFRDGPRGVTDTDTLQEGNSQDPEHDAGVRLVHVEYYPDAADCLSDVLAACVDDATKSSVQSGRTPYHASACLDLSCRGVGKESDSSYANCLERLTLPLFTANSPEPAASLSSSASPAGSSAVSLTIYLCAGANNKKSAPVVLTQRQTHNSSTNESKPEFGSMQPPSVVYIDWLSQNSSFNAAVCDNDALVVHVPKHVHLVIDGGVEVRGFLLVKGRLTLRRGCSFRGCLRAEQSGVISIESSSTVHLHRALSFPQRRPSSHVVASLPQRSSGILCLDESRVTVQASSVQLPPLPTRAGADDVTADASLAALTPEYHDWSGQSAVFASNSSHLSLHDSVMCAARPVAALIGAEQWAVVSAVRTLCSLNFHTSNQRVFNGYAGADGGAVAMPTICHVVRLVGGGTARMDRCWLSGADGTAHGETHAPLSHPPRSGTRTIGIGVRGGATLTATGCTVSACNVAVDVRLQSVALLQRCCLHAGSRAARVANAVLTLGDCALVSGAVGVHMAASAKCVIHGSRSLQLQRWSDTVRRRSTSLNFAKSSMPREEAPDTDEFLACWQAGELALLRRRCDANANDTAEDNTVDATPTDRGGNARLPWEELPTPLKLILQSHTNKPSAPTSCRAVGVIDAALDTVSAAGMCVYLSRHARLFKPEETDALSSFIFAPEAVVAADGRLSVSDTVVMGAHSGMCVHDTCTAEVRGTVVWCLTTASDATADMGRRALSSSRATPFADPCTRHFTDSNVRRIALILCGSSSEMVMERSAVIGGDSGVCCCAGASFRAKECALTAMPIGVSLFSSSLTMSDCLVDVSQQMISADSSQVTVSGSLLDLPNASGELTSSLLMSSGSGIECKGQCQLTATAVEMRCGCGGFIVSVNEGTHATLSHCALLGSSGATAAGVRVANGGGTVKISHCQVHSCDCGIVCSGPGASVLASGTTVVGGFTGVSTVGGRVHLSECLIRDCRAVGLSLSAQGSCTCDGIEVRDCQCGVQCGGGTLHVYGQLAVAGLCETGIRMTSSGSHMACNKGSRLVVALGETSSHGVSAAGVTPFGSSAENCQQNHCNVVHSPATVVKVHVGLYVESCSAIISDLVVSGAPTAVHAQGTGCRLAISCADLRATGTALLLSPGATVTVARGQVVGRLWSVLCHRQTRCVLGFLQPQHAPPLSYRQQYAATPKASGGLAARVMRWFTRSPSALAQTEPDVSEARMFMAAAASELGSAGNVVTGKVPSVPGDDSLEWFKKSESTTSGSSCFCRRVFHSVGEEDDGEDNMHCPMPNVSSSRHDADFNVSVDGAVCVSGRCAFHSVLMLLSPVRVPAHVIDPALLPLACVYCTRGGHLSLCDCSLVVDAPEPSAVDASAGHYDRYGIFHEADSRGSSARQHDHAVLLVGQGKGSRVEVFHCTLRAREATDSDDASTAEHAQAHPANLRALRIIIRDECAARLHCLAGHGHGVGRSLSLPASAPSYAAWMEPPLQLQMTLQSGAEALVTQVGAVSRLDVSSGALIVLQRCSLSLCGSRNVQVKTCHHTQPSATAEQSRCPVTVQGNGTFAYLTQCCVHVLKHSGDNKQDRTTPPLASTLLSHCSEGATLSLYQCIRVDEETQ